MAANNGYSAKVVLTLLVDGRKLALSHVGPSGIVVRDECNPIPACEAKILIQVDDSKKFRRIFLPHGVPGPRQTVAFL